MTTHDDPAGHAAQPLLAAQPLPPRPHTGRRRNDAARQAILDVTFDLLRTQGAEGLTIDAIAAAAGVGRQTIYRWWPNKIAVVVDAITQHARTIAPVRDSGSFRDDLGAFVRDSFTAAGQAGMLRALRQLGAAAQQDEQVADVVADFTAQRRGVLRSLLVRGQASGDVSPAADLDVLADIVFGVLWYRALISREPLDAGAADRLTACLLIAGGLT
jgi:AcrR family transcriptional regulator